MEIKMDMDEIKDIKHKVREGWRWKKFQAFKRKCRRDARELRGVTYKGERLKAARELAGNMGQRVNIILGAFYSPAAAKAAGGGVWLFVAGLVILVIFRVFSVYVGMIQDAASKI